MSGRNEQLNRIVLDTPLADDQRRPAAFSQHGHLVAVTRHNNNSSDTERAIEYTSLFLANEKIYRTTDQLWLRRETVQWPGRIIETTEVLAKCSHVWFIVC